MVVQSLSSPVRVAVVVHRPQPPTTRTMNEMAHLKCEVVQKLGRSNLEDVQELRKLVSQLGKGVETMAIDNAILNEENCKLHQEAREAARTKENGKSTCNKRCYANVRIIKEKNAKKIGQDRNQKEDERAAKKAARSAAATSKAQKAPGKKKKGKRVSFINLVKDSESADELEYDSEISDKQ